MNEPLNTSLTSINFSGKSYNYRPDWRNTAWIINLGSNEPSNPVRPTLRKIIKEPVVNDDQQARFSKPARLIEKAQSHPEQVISEVFDQVTHTDLTEDPFPLGCREPLLIHKVRIRMGMDGKSCMSSMRGCCRL